MYTPAVAPRSRTTARADAQRARSLEAIARWHAVFSAEHAAACLAKDPLQFARRYEARDDRELVALVSALLAFGNIGVITRKLAELLVRLGPSPARAVRDTPRAALIVRLRTFRHRTFAGADIARLLWAAGRVQSRDGGLYVSLERAFDELGALRPALARWVEELRALAWPDGLTRASRHLLPDPTGPSAAKRLMLLLRWVARPDDGVDLGLSRLPTRALEVPVDVHVHRIARNLGLTSRTDASRHTAEEITAALRALDPDDPVRYDMAVCHLGIARRCPSRRDPVRCDGCALRDVCVHWG